MKRLLDLLEALAFYGVVIFGVLVVMYGIIMAIYVVTM